MGGSWLTLHRSLALIRDGKVADGEKILNDAIIKDAILKNSVSSNDGRSEDWRIYANLGRIQESRRAISTALDYYERAAALVREKKSAALLQMRLSRCLEALGRTEESRRAIDYALELDPENINIRREARRR
jgi:tetratricopeptide (TPR) repeat protein